MNFHDFTLVCADGTATVLGFLDPTIAPPFMYYAYIPIVFVSLIFASLIFFETEGKQGSRILLWVTVLFSLNLLSEILLWISTPVLLIHFVWEILAIFHILIIALTGYFVYVFVARTDLPLIWKWLWLMPIAALLILVPTPINLSGFDITNCESIQGVLWNYIYAFDALVAAGVLLFTIRQLQITKNPDGFSKIRILGMGAALFIAIFSASYYIGDVTLIYNINLLGPLGMVAFLVCLTFLIVKYHAFNLRILGAQALVAALIIAIFSALFVQSIQHVRYVLLGTLALIIILGVMLVRGVMREVRQRERLEVLSKELATANSRLKELDQLKSEFLSIASHQLRAPITAVRGYAANINEGMYGPVPEHLKEPLDVVQESARLMTNSIEDYLNISRIEQGRMKYEKSSFDITNLVTKVIQELTPIAAKKKLALSTAPSTSITVNADVGKIKQVIVNLVDNAIKYTNEGSVTVRTETGDKTARVIIQDTGVGIPAEEIGGLFEKFTRARGANKVNTTGTGLGLYVAKQLVEGHGGKVWAESDGAGKGSRFIVELPL